MALMPAVIISLTLALYFIVLRYNDADAALLGRGNALARQLAPAAEYGAFSGNIVELHRLAEAASHEPDVTAVSFHDRKGALLASVGKMHFSDNVTALPSGWEGRSKDGDTLFFHTKIQHTAQPFEDPFAQKSDKEGLKLPLGSVTLEMSRIAVLKRKREILFVTILFSLAALAAGTLLAQRLSRDVTEPILALQKTMAQIHDGRLNARVPRHQAGTLRSLEEGINEMAAAIMAGRDHLERRIAEATLELRQKKEEAEHTSLAKSRFLAAASHDLRQPLHALSLFTAELEQQPSSLAQRRLLQQIGSAVDALNEQLNALLDISRLDLGDIIAHPKPLALEPLIERVVAVHAPEAQAKGLRLRYVPTTAWTESDPLLLERMLGNLLANAISYTSKGGIVIGMRHVGTDWQLQVWDSGIGISEEQLPLIFQEFYQVANPERAADKGLGLGLAIVSRLAQILAHPIEVRSLPGHGSVFSILLPRSKPPVPRKGQLEQKNNELFEFDIDVLVFSGACDERASLCNLLEGWGCRAACAADMAEVEESTRCRPDVLICDEERLPAATDFIDRHPDKTQLPILILLGETSRMVAVNTGLTYAQLALPLRPARLRALLQQLLQARKETTLHET